VSRWYLDTLAFLLELTPYSHTDPGVRIKNHVTYTAVRDKHLLACLLVGCFGRVWLRSEAQFSFTTLLNWVCRDSNIKKYLARGIFLNYMIPAFLRVLNAPCFWMVFSARVEMVRVIDFFSSGTKIFFFWRFGCRRTFPQGLNWVARVRLEYRPPIIDPF